MNPSAQGDGPFWPLTVGFQKETTGLMDQHCYFYAGKKVLMRKEVKEYKLTVWNW